MGDARRVRATWAGLLFCAGGAACIACGGSDGAISFGDDGGPVEGGTPIDAGADATVDDATVDTGAGDATVDTGSDARSDSGSDSGLDSGSDSGSDSGLDSGLDSGSDSGSCPAPTAGAVYVAPSGSDLTGNGSQTCPFVTITKALSTTAGASVATTIYVASGPGAALFVYGTGCTAGAGKCDVTPIHVTDVMSSGIVIQGTGADPSALRVVGGVAAGDVAVFVVNAPNVGFANLTVAPRKIATGSGGGRVAGAIGVLFAAPPAPAGQEATVTNVIVDGVIRIGATESTSSGIAMLGGTSPTVGPGVTIVGGDHSVLVTQQNGGAPVAASNPIITSSAAAPSFFHSSQFACVRVESANGGAQAVPSATLTATTAGDPGRLHLQDCGGNGGVVVATGKPPSAIVEVARTLIDTSGPSAPAYYGIRLQGAGTLSAGPAVTITGIGEISAGVGAGIEAIDTASLAINASSGPVDVVANGATGVHIGGNATATINGLNSSGNRAGLICDASNGNGASLNLLLRGATLLENKTFGAFIANRPGGGACVADLGGGVSGGLGNNIYNRTSKKNGAVGLCYLANTPASATSSTWGCGLPASSACTPATVTSPSPLVVSQCDQVGDHNSSAFLTVALPQTCCGL